MSIQDEYAKEDIVKVSAPRIKLVRQALGLTQQKFSEIFSDGEYKMVSHWENGKAHPPASKLEELLQFLVAPRSCRTDLLPERGTAALELFPWSDPLDREREAPRRFIVAKSN